MGLLDRLFRRRRRSDTRHKPSNAAPRSHQLPSHMVAAEFGEVNVLNHRDGIDVTLTILMEPMGAAAEGWQTGVALDASGSMETAFGRGIVSAGHQGPPDALLDEYSRRGWLKVVEQGGRRVSILSMEARRDLVERGYFHWSPNEVEPVARRATAYLAANLDADGGTTVIYWACGDGAQIETVGDLTAEACAQADFAGPSKHEFGRGTLLTPAVRYFAERFTDARNGMYIFITDGEIQDLEQAKKYTIGLCRDIEAKRRNPLKCVLIGLGENIDEDQMAELDDLDSGTSVDIWDHKISREMRSMQEIFAEVVSAHHLVAPTARILNCGGNVVKTYSDGLPAKISFTLTPGTSWFELEVGGNRIRQPVVITPNEVIVP